MRLDNLLQCDHSTLRGNSFLLFLIAVFIFHNLVESSNNYSAAYNEDFIISKLKHSVVVEELNISVDEFFSLFVKDGAPFGIEK